MILMTQGTVMVSEKSDEEIYDFQLYHPLQHGYATWILGSMSSYCLGVPTFILRAVRYPYYIQ